MNNRTPCESNSNSSPYAIAAGETARVLTFGTLVGAGLYPFGIMHSYIHSNGMPNPYTILATTFRASVVLTSVKGLATAIPASCLRSATIAQREKIKNLFPSAEKSEPTPNGSSANINWNSFRQNMGLAVAVTILETSGTNYFSNKTAWKVYAIHNSTFVQPSLITLRANFQAFTLGYGSRAARNLINITGLIAVSELEKSGWSKNIATTVCGVTAGLGMHFFDTINKTQIKAVKPDLTTLDLTSATKKVVREGILRRGLFSQIVISSTAFHLINRVEPLAEQMAQKANVSTHRFLQAKQTVSEKTTYDQRYPLAPAKR
jgi:hypothetical protein